MMLILIVSAAATLPLAALVAWVREPGRERLVLAALIHHVHGLQASQVGQAAGVRAAYLTLSRLADRGLVLAERDERADEREKLGLPRLTRYRLTPKGLAAAERLGAEARMSER